MFLKIAFDNSDIARRLLEGGDGMTQETSPKDMGDRLQTADVSKLTYELEKSKKKTKLLKQAIWGLSV